MDEFLQYLPRSFDNNEFIDTSDCLNELLSDNDSARLKVETTIIQDCEPLAGPSRQEERSTPSFLPAEKQSAVFCVGDSSTPAMASKKNNKKRKRDAKETTLPTFPIRNVTIEKLEDGTIDPWVPQSGGQSSEIEFRNQRFLVPCWWSKLPSSLQRGLRHRIITEIGRHGLEGAYFVYGRYCIIKNGELIQVNL